MNLGARETKCISPGEETGLPVCAGADMLSVGKPSLGHSWHMAGCVRLGVCLLHLLRGFGGPESKRLVRQESIFHLFLASSPGTLEG